jgi:hypothetical protein
MAEMLLAKDQDVIEAVPPDRSDQPFRESTIKSSQLHLFRHLLCRLCVELEAALDLATPGGSRAPVLSRV